MQIQSVRDTGRVVKLEYDGGDGRDSITCKFSSPDRPVADFTDALQAFAVPALEAIGLSTELEVEVRAVTVSYDDENELERVHVHLLKPVSNSNRPLNINTPELDLDKFDEFVPLIETLHEEAEEYFSRKKRAQVDAFEGEDAEEEDEDEDEEEAEESEQHELEPAGV